MIGIVAEDEAPTAAQMTRGLKALRSMLKTWQVDGAMDWLVTDAWMTLQAGKRTYFMGGYDMGLGYDFPHRPLEIHNVSISDGPNDLHMELLSREDYHDLPNKGYGGLPLKAFFDPQLGQGRLYVWPIPQREHVVKFS